MEIVIPSTKKLKYINELNNLDLDKSKFTIIGSSIMTIYGIRENDDIDISVTEDLFNEISYDTRFVEENYPNNIISYRYKHISVFKGNFPMTKSPQQLIDESIVIDGYNFISIETLIEWKELNGREKDKDDLKLLKKFNK